MANIMPARTSSIYNAQAHNDSRTSQRDVAALLSAVSHHVGSIRLEAIVLETKQDCLGIEFRPQLQAGLSRSCRGKSTGVLKASKLRTANVNWPCSQVGPVRFKPHTNPGWHSIWVVLENRVPHGPSFSPQNTTTPFKNEPKRDPKLESYPSA